MRVVRQSGSTEAAPPQLAEPGSERRWSQLQALRRGRGPLEVWIEALDSGALTVAADLLAAIWSRLGPAAAERLLAGSAAAEAEPWLRAGLQELPAMASRRQVSEIWLEPLLRRHAAAAAEAGVASPEALAWLQLLGLIREARVAHRLREQVMALTAAGFRSDGSEIGRAHV